MKAVTVEFQHDVFSLSDICERCMVDDTVIISLVEQGIAEPDGSTVSEWQFSASGYLRIRKALRLKKDLAINDPGVALALDLLERLEVANREVEYLRKRLGQDE